MTTQHNTRSATASSRVPAQPGQAAQHAGAVLTQEADGLWEGAAGAGGTAYLFGLHRGCTAVPTVVVAEGSVVDSVTVVVSHEGLYRGTEAGRQGALLVWTEWGRASVII